MKNLSLLFLVIFCLQISVRAQQGWIEQNSGIIDTLPGVKFIGWTNVNGNTSTFYWNTKPVKRWIGDPSTVQEDVYTFDDYRVTVDTTLIGGLYARWFDFFTGISYDTTFHLPLKVDVVTTPNHPIDVSDNTWLMEFAVQAPWEEYRKYYYSQLGWDLVPGGLAYTAGSAGFYERYLDLLNFEKYEIDPLTGDTTFTGLLLQTNHQPDTYVDAYGDTVHINAVAPSHGDEFTVKTYKPYHFNSVSFISEEIGWSAGGYSASNSSKGVVVHTTDGGVNWIEQEVSSYEISSVFFINADTGWAVTLASINSAVLGENLKTTNGGEDWIISRELLNHTLHDIFFVNVDTGWTVGSYGLIDKSTDGGENWITQLSGTNVTLKSVYFIDQNNGWSVGDDGVILNTINGGENWLQQTSGIGTNLNSVQFIDQNTGWVAGDSAVVLKTTNGGINWLLKTVPGYSFTSVCFVNESHGWIVGHSDFSADGGVIINTVDGGENWNLQAETKNLRAIKFVDQNTGWTVGDTASIYHTTNGGVSFIDEEKFNGIPIRYNLNDNYPNPFNPSTKIRYSIPQSSNVVIKVFDILGNEIETLVNEEKPIGTYEITWYPKNLTSGIYFYQLQAETFVETKKMILLK